MDLFMTQTLLTGGIFLVIGLIIIYVISKVLNEYRNLQKKYSELNHLFLNKCDEMSTSAELVEDLREALAAEREKNKKIVSQKKSSETKIGQISEQLLPVLNECPYDPKKMHFLGNPLDYIIFDVDLGEIVFLEVKSGNSRASKKQRTIKNIIKEGRVYYEEMRISPKGITAKREENE